jgi:hypothetical protein
MALRVACGAGVALRVAGVPEGGFSAACGTFGAFPPAVPQRLDRSGRPARTIPERPEAPFRSAAGSARNGWTSASSFRFLPPRGQAAAIMGEGGGTVAGAILAG